MRADYSVETVAENPIFPLNDKTTKLRDEFLKLGRQLNLEVRSGVNQASDHTPFAAKDIDYVWLINMDLESGYHTTKDTSDKIDAKRSKEICKLVLYYLDRNIY